MLAECDLERWLGTVEAGRPASVFADDVEDVRNVLEQLITSERELARVVSLSWTEIPSLGNELGLLVNALARACTELFPSLYGATHSVPSSCTESELSAELRAITRRLPEVHGPACREILLACRNGRIPRVRNMSNSEQVRQLALAIEPRRLVVLIAELSRTPHPANLRGLAQGAEWLASNTRSRVILILPSELRAATELDHVTYTTCSFSRRNVEGAAPKGTKEGCKQDNVNKLRKLQREPNVCVSAVVGKPHPASDAEMALHRQITRDEELRPLFAYNQPVTTVYDTKPTVDLLWDAGRFIIEIDGSDHRREQKFTEDRKRDFELFMSGYHVTRFTSSRVIEQTDNVISQIRAAVRYLRDREKK